MNETEPALTTPPADRTWGALPQGMTLWRPAPGPLVVVAPHPDDETLGAGGLITTCAEQGADITVVLLTDGEAARRDQPDLGAIRVAELRAALSLLSPRGWHLHRMKLPDGEVGQHEAELERVLEQRLSRGATLVAPFEFDGHIDHDAAGRACLAVARKLGVPVVRYAIWAWHLLGERAFDTRPLGRFRLTGKAQATKVRALSCYASQTEVGLDGSVLPPHVLTFFKRSYEVYLL